MSAALGNVNRKEAPLPASDWHQIFPPCDSTIFRLIARPSPDPERLSVSWDNRLKGSNIFSRYSASMPGPLSRTSNRHRALDCLGVAVVVIDEQNVQRLAADRC